MASSALSTLVVSWASTVRKFENLFCYSDFTWNQFRENFDEAYPKRVILPCLEVLNFAFLCSIYYQKIVYHIRICRRANFVICYVELEDFSSLWPIFLQKKYLSS